MTKSGRSLSRRKIKIASNDKQNFKFNSIFIYSVTIMNWDFSSLGINNDDMLYRNLAYISALAAFNSEREQIIIKFFDFIFRNNMLQKRHITAKDVEDFCRKNYEEL